MANGQRTYDPATTQALLSTFDAAQAECWSIRAGVDMASDSLAASYRGDAATRYQQSMGEWLSGFNRVQNALNLLNESMGQYRMITIATEMNNQATAGGWAQGTAPTDLVRGPLAGDAPRVRGALAEDVPLVRGALAEDVPRVRGALAEDVALPKGWGEGRVEHAVPSNGPGEGRVSHELPSDRASG